MVDFTPLSDDVGMRLLHTEDVSGLAAAYVRNREHLAPWEPDRGDHFFTPDGQARSVSHALDEYAVGKGVPLVLTAGTRIVGRVNINSIVRGSFQNCHLGYWIAADVEGKGFMTRAIAAAVAVVRDELGLHRIEAATLVHNAASQRVLLANGFEEYGTAPRYLKIAGRWQDHRVFQLLLHD